MSKTLIQLDDRIITDEGKVVADFELLLRKALSGEVFTGIPALHHSDIDLYNQRTGNTVHPEIPIWEEGDEFSSPPDDTFDWNIPQEYKELDINVAIIQGLVDKSLDDNGKYLGRLDQELGLMRSRQMEDFFKCLIYIRDTLRKNDLFWGVGRGSSCASLILFLLDINKVDPVKFDIDPQEFYK